MTQDEFERFMTKTFSSLQTLQKVKGGEYAEHTDAFANFRASAVDLGVNLGTVWRVLAGKHWLAISHYIRDMQTEVSRPRSEPIGGRIDDLIVYLVLLKAMLCERDLPVEGRGK